MYHTWKGKKDHYDDSICTAPGQQAHAARLHWHAAGESSGTWAELDLIHQLPLFLCCHPTQAMHGDLVRVMMHVNSFTPVCGCQGNPDVLAPLHS
eukprot:1151813-Pelagomonas_calceolata.AAC.8